MRWLYQVPLRLRSLFRKQNTEKELSEEIQFHVESQIAELYNQSPRDPLSFLSAFVVLVIASLAACFVPAWRAARTDLLRALRN
jgi:ABC-type lipoprotein release transport system permease subunit